MVLAGLGTMKLVEIVKEMVPWPLQPWTKSALSILLGLTGAWLLAGKQDASRLVGLGLGSAGLASMAHEVRGTLSVTGDWFKQQVILRAGTRRR